MAAVARSHSKHLIVIRTDNRIAKCDKNLYKLAHTIIKSNVDLLVPTYSLNSTEKLAVSVLFLHRVACSVRFFVILKFETDIFYRNVLA